MPRSWRVFTLVSSLVLVTLTFHPPLPGAPITQSVHPAGDTVVYSYFPGRPGAPICRLVEHGRIGTTDGNAGTEFNRILGLAADGLGHLYVSDEKGPGNGPILRAFHTNGSLLRIIGHVGSGPGEYRALDGGLTTLPDARLVVRDASNGRFVVFDSLGKLLDHWNLRPLHGFDPPLYREGHGGILSLIVKPPAPGRTDPGSMYIFQRVTGAGKVADTIGLPVPRVPAGVALVTQGGGTGTFDVPLTPEEVYTWRTGIGWLVGRSDQFALTLRQHDSLIRVEQRTALPPTFAPGEREAVVAEFRRMTNNGTVLSGPGIPQHKPFLRRAWSDHTGRTWVLLHRTGVPYRDTDADGRSTTRWREPLAFLLISPTGKPEMTVEGPAIPLTLRVSPAIVGDTIWLASQDADGVPQVARLQLHCP